MNCSRASNPATPRETTRLAHALKGSAANLSAVKVAALAAQLEELGRASDLGAAESVVEALGVEIDRCRKALQTLPGEVTPQDSQSNLRTPGKVGEAS